MKKKVLFMLINMNIGGTEKALLNMISEMPKDKYDITILMLERYGGFLNQIPDHVHIEYLIGYRRIKNLLKLPPKEIAALFMKKCHFIKLVNFLFFMLVSKITKEKSLFYKYLCRYVADFKHYYDIAVAYAGPMDFISFFVAHKIKAKRKIQWIHFDITKIGFNKYFALKIYKKFDKLFIVSKEARNKLIDMLPKLEDKSAVITNVVSPAIIKKQANDGDGFEDQFEGFRILTVGRLSYEKGQDIAIRAFYRLIKDGYNIKWYCIGDGKIRGQIENLIKNFNLMERFILLGENPNPYSYMEQCDIYVQPSRYEGYCISLLEAKLFKKPIVTTDVNGAKEQIINGVTGFIIGIEENQLYEAIKHLLDNELLRQSFKRNLYNEQFKESNDLEKLYEFVDGMK